MKFLFYVEGGEAGFGHLRRCDALSQELVRRGSTCDFLSTGVEATSWLESHGLHVKKDADAGLYDAMVIDSYVISKEKIHEFGTKCAYLIGFHDYEEPNTDFRLLISCIYPGKQRLGTTLILGGHEYKIIHPFIKKVVSAQISEKITSCAVTFGGRSVMKELARSVATPLHVRFPDIDFKIVAGLSDAEAAKIFGAVDIAISGGGQTMGELIYLGTPAIVVSLDTFMEAQIEEAVLYGAIRKAGNIEDADLVDKIAENLDSIYSKPARESLRAKAKSFIDGRGQERIVDTIEEYFHEKI